MTGAVEVTTAFVGGGGFTAALAFLRFLIQQRAKKKARAVPDVLSMIHETYSLMNMMLDETRASSIILMRAENGGRVPRLGQELYSSIVYEVYRHPLKSLKATWQRQALDEQYITMLMKVSTEVETRIETAHLDSSLLKTQFEANSIACSERWALYGSEGAFFYLALNYANGIEPRWDDARHKEICRSTLNRLRTLFAKQYEKAK